MMVCRSSLQCVPAADEILEIYSFCKKMNKNTNIS